MAESVVKINGDIFKGVEEAVKRGVLETAIGIQGHAKQLAPVDSGRLRNSIDVEPEGDDVAYVGTNVEYAPYVEFGTRRQKAQPYLRPAAKMVDMRKLKRITNKKLRDSLKKGVKVYKF